MDAVDRQLIQALRENGRASYAELGRLVGLSGPSVTDRINRLEAAGVITGYRATVDAASLGLGVTALIGISSIQLLKTFVNIGDQKFTDNAVMWQILVHLTFVVSALLLAWTDRISTTTAIEARSKAH